MDGVHDMGGMHGFGPVVTADGHLSHHEPWEVRAQVLAILSRRSTMRPPIEALDPATYLASSYYVRWLRAAETSVVERGQLTGDDLERWRATFATDLDAQPPATSDLERVERVRSMQPFAFEPAPDAAFAVGDRVRVRRMRPEHHHRCPRYIRGATGTIEKVLGLDQVPGLPDSDRTSEPCYTVELSSVELFGDASGDGEPPYTVLIDLWERYLEAPA